VWAGFSPQPNLKMWHLAFTEFILHIKRHIQNLTSFHSKLDQTIIYTGCFLKFGVEGSIVNEPLLIRFLSRFLVHLLIYLGRILFYSCTHHFVFLYVRNRLFLFVKSLIMHTLCNKVILKI
jgi:hypothetical protein